MLIKQSSTSATTDVEPTETASSARSCSAGADELITVPDRFRAQQEARARNSPSAKTTLQARAKSIGGWRRLGVRIADLSDGTPIRLTGQDTERGTFSHRHAVLHDADDQREVRSAAARLGDAKASFEIYNSPLSEYACVGFEYGYSVVAPNALVLWEAQFGDFNNGAQIIIDQFIAAGAAKWGQTTRLTLLLPHGYEGAGPEHSSAPHRTFPRSSRPKGNIRVANCLDAVTVLPPAADAGAGPSRFPDGHLHAEIAAAQRASRSERSTSLSNGAFQRVIDDPR